MATRSTVFQSPVLVVSTEPKVIELTNAYTVLDGHGLPLGSVVEVGQTRLRKALRLVAGVDRHLARRLEVRDTTGSRVLEVSRPATWLRSTVVVSGEDGTEVGRIAQQNKIGKIHFALLSDGRQIGEMRAENLRAWDFSLVDAGGVEVARVKKTWEGVAKTLLTTADTYVVRVHRPLTDPLLSLVVASALTIDTALKQARRGLT